MPANLTPEYRAAEARYRSARNDEDRLTALEEMYAVVPKHKGTEKIRADIKHRISKIRNNIKISNESNVSEIIHITNFSKCLALIGLPKSGKSSIISLLESSGLLRNIEIIDLPSLSLNNSSAQTINLLKNIEEICIVLDGSDDMLIDRFEEIREYLSSHNIVFSRKSNDGILPMVIVSKIDIYGAAENYKVFSDCYSNEYCIFCVSSKTGQGIDNLEINVRGRFEKEYRDV